MMGFVKAERADAYRGLKSGEPDSVCLSFRGGGLERAAHIELTIERATELRDALTRQLNTCQRPEGK